MEHKQCSHQPCSQHDNPSYTNYQATVRQPAVQIQFRRSFENGILREPVSAAVQCDQWLQDLTALSLGSITWAALFIADLGSKPTKKYTFKKRLSYVIDVFLGTCSVPWCRHLLTLHLGGLGLFLGYFLWGMWWIKWPGGWVSSKYFRFPLSVS